MRRPLALLFATMMALPLACDGDSGDDGSADTGGDGGGDRVATILGLTGDSGSGATVYTNNCGIASCHGPAGNDGTAPALQDQVAGLSDEDIVDVMLVGVDASASESGMIMTPLAHLADQELADVLAYVKATF